MLPAGDGTLVQIVDAALADSARRSGEWLVCRPGCHQCCIGVFQISQLDVLRLRAGMAELQKKDPERAAAVRQRARESVERLGAGFPGDPETGLLAEDEASQAVFEEFGNDEPCPVLEPGSGRCELYAHRPILCRTFGPPVNEGEPEGLSICELCYNGVTDEQIATCEMVPDPEGLQTPLIEQAERITGRHGETLVAFALALDPA